MELKCEWCGNQIQSKSRHVYPSQRPRTCSRSCGVKLARSEGRANFKTERFCEVCGKRIKGRSKRTCSRSCGVRLAQQEGRWHLPTNGSRESNTNWRGGRKILPNGYVYVLAPADYPNGTTKNGRRRYVAEHRLVVEQRIGRFLTETEFVHHVNGIKWDNRPENLKIVTYATHRGEIVCPHCLGTFSLK